MNITEQAVNQDGNKTPAQPAAVDRRDTRIAELEAQVQTLTTQRSDARRSEALIKLAASGKWKCSVETVAKLMATEWEYDEETGTLADPSKHWLTSHEDGVVPKIETTG